MRVQRNRAFTLVEMLVVMAIIVLMASALVVTVQGVRTRAAVHAAKAQAAGIQMAVEDHKSQFGYYPTRDRFLYASATNNLDPCLTAEQKLAAFLWRAGYEYKENDYALYYVYDDTILPPNNMLDEDGNPAPAATALQLPVLVDLYGNQIGFEIVGQAYKIYSLGPDGVTGGNDGLDNNGNGSVDEDLNEDGIDNDGDGEIDEDDEDLHRDGVDNDGDGQIDEDDEDENAMNGTVGDDIMP